MQMKIHCVILLFLAGTIWAGPAKAQQFNPDLYAGMRWRQVGPFRGGRVSAVAGVIGRPGVYYMASPGGGVWKTTDAGMVWLPIFDQAHVASIGALAVAPSNSKIIYVGTGDFGIASNSWGAANRGDGVWRSDDGGRTWRHIGLSDTAHIGAILVDPTNPNVALVAALGNAYRPDPHRGVYLTTNGGRTWTRTLFKNDTTGAISLTYDVARSGVVYAALWHHQAALLPAPPDSDQAGGAIYKSTDGGRTWRALSGQGLPTWPMGRIGLAADGGRVFADIARAEGHHGRLPGGLFRSDDGGATWRRITEDPRLTPGGRSGYFNNVYMDPQNRNVVFAVQTSFYRSTDGGKTFEALKGSPGGDDYHELWINPKSPCLPMAGGKGCLSSEMILGADQGASVSLNAGQTWSTWYNQPTGQMYHLSTDNRFPFHIYGPQQDNGSVEVSSRGAFGDISFLDWRPSMGAYEYGYVEPEPTHPQWIFASDGGPVVHRRVRGTWLTLNVSPYIGSGGPYRYLMGPWWGSVRPPFVFSPENGNVLYYGAQFLLETSDAGRDWRRISPDLTVRANLPARAMPDGKTSSDWAAISAIGPSPLSAGVIWIGTDDGLLQVTRDGGTSWQRATIPALRPFDIISMIKASPSNPAEAYVVMDRHVWGDFRPYVYRTDDYGHTWTAIASGIPDGSFVRVVQADPKRQGLLYAGTENGVYVSFNDGEEWQSLQLNLPTAAVRDLTIRDGDLVAATFGRAFWILDDLSPLEQLNAQAAAAPDHLFRPADAIRVHRDTNSDTPFPPEVPAGTNPPSGAILDYTLHTAPPQSIELAIYDASGNLVRRFSSAPLPESVRRPVKWPIIADYWMANPQPLSTRVGMNRFVWDLRYSPPPAVHYSYPMSAIPHETPAGPEGPLVVPGKYTVRLTVAGQTYSQPLTVRRDPRETAPASAFAAELSLEQKIMAGMRESYQAYRAAKQHGDSAAARQFAGLNGTLDGLATDIDGADAAPTSAMQEAVHRVLERLASTRKNF
ncbi:MAG: WD40/YVTN/BNR-like repeat-containing protein [Terriglobia bacterium]